MLKVVRLPVTRKRNNILTIKGAARNILSVILHCNN